MRLTLKHWGLFVPIILNWRSENSHEQQMAAAFFRFKTGVAGITGWQDRILWLTLSMISPIARNVQVTQDWKSDSYCQWRNFDLAAKNMESSLLEVDIITHSKLENAGGIYIIFICILRDQAPIASVRVLLAACLFAPLLIKNKGSDLAQKPACTITQGKVITVSSSAIR